MLSRTSVWLYSIIPIIVGVTALTVLDGQLGNLSPDAFKRLFTNPYLRAATLFGAAYGSNGARFWPAFFAIYVYFSVVSTGGWDSEKGHPEDRFLNFRQREEIRHDQTPAPYPTGAQSGATFQTFENPSSDL